MGKKKHIINLMFTVTLLGLFALAALFVAVMGARVYSHSAEKMEANYDTRTSLVYISEKIRQSPGDNVTIGKIDGEDALVLSRDIEGSTYESWIYVYNGRLSETMISQGTEIFPGAGESIMDLSGMQVEKKGDLITVTVETDKGDSNSVSIWLRG